MGEGVEDVTINRWVVNEGDEVNEGDVIVEVATDKVDTEVPAPTSGTLLKVNFSEGELAPIDAVLAVIGAEGEEAGEANGAQPTAAAAEPEPAEAPAPQAAEPAAAPPSENGVDVKATPVAKRVAEEKGVSLRSVAGTGPNGQITKQDVLNYAGGEAGAPSQGEEEALPGDLADVAPLPVRRLAAENDIDLAEIADGRPLSALTKYDVLSAVASRAAGEPVVVEPSFAPPQPEPQPTAPAPAAPTADAEAKPAPPAPPAPAELGAGEELVKPNRMRLAIAKNTFASLQSAPQLTTWHDVDMTAVLQHRKAHKQEFAAQGVNLTVTAYLIAATVEGLRRIPAANAKWTDDGILIKRYYNIGMAAAMPADEYGLGGLIVPVIHNAGDLNLLGIARRVNELGEKARGSKLTSSELQGGTFTLTNYGTSGSVFQTPIIHEGQAGILGTGAVEKRAVVVSNGHPLEPNMGDHLSFKPMMTLAFTFDHRVLDGATADAFCVAVKETLENWS
jgi:2-oxoglutarate dehydrogenase E2 component (dihydrolipoamide succinyltransferase)